MLTTLKILKGKALLHKTIKIADGTMSVKDYVAGAERAAGLPRRDV